ncbi:hypothetical protein QLL95_gp0577 [Cotonvirus japonicus]|uniref:Uncharacterized protein n=1 Tax=Cotonvirus japonicus TaxID=2811091 RepID=A0ABM7NTV8_9VIRU|nr:hypothetical protein QLL95_gp0577 [Cotonvirus japonicus]BCS83546.1 hypothetical protein [Cotonvirus japonicus]
MSSPNKSPIVLILLYVLICVTNNLWSYSIAGIFYILVSIINQYIYHKPHYHDRILPTDYVIYGAIIGTSFGFILDILCRFLSECWSRSELQFTTYILTFVMASCGGFYAKFMT